MKTTVLALLAAAALTGCMATTKTCMQPDPVQPASSCWNNGVNCGEAIVPVNQ